MLIQAADAGKQVAVLVELKARFDERNNIQWANRLEEAGIHVVYGVANLKTHCKLCLVVRREAGGVRRYAHIGTGNYNRATSQVYTDFGLFTANPRVLEDVSGGLQLADRLLRPPGVRRAARRAGHAPRPRMLALIEREIAHAQAGRAAQDHRQEQRGDRSADRPRAVSGRRGRRHDRSDRPRRLRAAEPGSRASASAFRSGRSSAGSSSTRASTAFENGGAARALHGQRRSDGTEPRSAGRDALPGRG